MKIIRENIQLNFERGQDPKQSMGLGKLKLIQDWMDGFGIGVKNYKVNPDYTIFTDMDVICMSRPDDFPSNGFPGGRFPEYIRFHTTGSFDVDDCGLVSLIGCPKRVEGYFSCQMNPLKDLVGFPEFVEKDVYCMGNNIEVTEAQIKEICGGYGKIEADDSEPI
jgi:hypothetical protein